MLFYSYYYHYLNVIIYNLLPGKNADDHCTIVCEWEGVFHSNMQLYLLLNY